MLTKILERYTGSEHALVCLLREIAILCRVLGEAVSSLNNNVLDAVLICLRHSNEYVRYVGALTLRALAEAIPDNTQTLLAALVNMVQISHAEAITIKDPQLLIKVRKFSLKLN
jgi:hypothetical protein